MKCVQWPEMWSGEVETKRFPKRFPKRTYLLIDRETCPMKWAKKMHQKATRFIIRLMKGFNLKLRIPKDTYAVL